jgi:hypothetical protein
MPAYLIKYGPEILDHADTLADARRKRLVMIYNDLPGTIYIVRTRDGRRFDS